MSINLKTSERLVNVDVDGRIIIIIIIKWIWRYKFYGFGLKSNSRWSWLKWPSSIPCYFPSWIVKICHILWRIYDSVFDFTKWTITYLWDTCRNNPSGHIYGIRTPYILTSTTATSHVIECPTYLAFTHPTIDLSSERNAIRTILSLISK